jgi:hypothetical protein
MKAELSIIPNLEVHEGKIHNKRKYYYEWKYILRIVIPEVDGGFTLHLDDNKHRTEEEIK